jgi:thiamine-monophosphate kinase
VTAPALGPGPEFDLIRAIARALGPAAGSLDDDCALVPDGATTLAFSTDISVENVHFRRDWLSPAEIGWRAAAGSLSDLAAEGAEAIGLLAAVTGPRSLAEHDLVELMRGVGEAAASAGGRVLGGDLSTAPYWSIAVTVVGRAARPVTRAGARPGDGLWVTGELGGARAALEAWLRGDQPAPGGHVHLQRLVPGARLRLRPEAAGVAFDELHRDEDLVLERADVVDDDDVRVRQARDRLRLAQRPLPPFEQRDAGARLDPQQLDRHLAIQLRIVRGVDLAHAAAADQPEDDVAANARATRERGLPVIRGR